MTMKKSIYFIAFLFFGQSVLSQTITKTTSNSNPYIGEEFFYTITVDNLNNLSDLDYIVDSFGPELEYLGVDYDATMLYLLNSNFGNLGCASFTDNQSTVHNFRLDFINCNGTVIGGYDSFSFKIRVRLTELACNLTGSYDNKAELYLKSAPSKPKMSNVESVTVNRNNPFQFQKAYRNTNSSGFIVYDIRLSSASGNFYPLDFNSNPAFQDEFTFPNCVNLDLNNVEVVHIIDENSSPMQHASSFTYNKSIAGNTLYLDWPLQGASELTTSILYQVKIKTDDCITCNQNYTLENKAFFTGKDRCGDPITKNDQSVINNTYCNTSNGSGGVSSVPDPIDCFIEFTKDVVLEDNFSNYTMAGCKGKYVITIKNCTDEIVYDFNLDDTLPSNLHIDGGQITIAGNATFQYQNSNLNVTPVSSKLHPTDVITIEIPFEVKETGPNIPINNCANLILNGRDNLGNPHNLTEQACAPTITTVPNKVAVVADKTLCSESGSNCGPFQNPDNLPGDEVEYTLHFYNYGTVEATNIKVKDVLPPHFKIVDLNNDVRVYTVKRGSFPDLCGDMTGVKDVTGDVSKNYSTTTNLLEIDMKDRILNEFTCEGITQYAVTIKAKIDMAAPNGVYDNIFVVNYNDPNNPNNNTTVSDKVTNVVNVNNLVIGAKTAANIYETDCETKTKKVTYEIIIANMGTYPVGININDVINIPNLASVVSIGNFQIATNGGTPITYPVSNVNAAGYFINGIGIQPCEYKTISYDVVYNTNLLTGSETVEVCNNAKVEVFIKNESEVIPLVTTEPSLIQNFINAKTDTEKLNAIALIKNYKQSSSRNIPGNINLGTTIFSECITLNDCLEGIGKGCFSSTSQPFNFQITGMNRNGEITTTLNNLSNEKITQIEYLLTDVRLVDTCEDDVAIVNGNSITRSCFGCSDNVTGIFSTTDTSPLGLLNYTSQPTLAGRYRESNKVEFKGAPTAITQDNRTFRFPVSVNCNGTYEFTITAIVYFEDCSVCYVTDSFDYNASWRFVIPPRPISTPVLTRPRSF